uniref:Putative cysteine rich secreted protein n=1 Tax=Amblyomma triste TaxID=251400 RepID=A0A023G8X2_AMBTT
MGCFRLILATVFLLGYALTVSATTCQSDADCAGGQRCVLHRNFSSSANCETDRRCISGTPTTCACEQGFQCFVRDCPTSPYECVVLEHQNTRCGGSNGPQCGPDQVCGYKDTGLRCIKCPCYGTDLATCVNKKPTIACGPNSIIRVTRDGQDYECDGCASVTSVLTALLH